MEKFKFVPFTSFEDAVKQVGKEETFRLLNRGKYDNDFRKHKRLKDQLLAELLEKDVRFKDLKAEILGDKLKKRA